MDMIREKFWLCLFFVFTVFIQLKSYCAVVEGGDTISLGASITGNQTIISKNGTFELGFFSPNGTNNWYIGIWYAHLTEKTFIWVANRENPARNRSGVLRLSKEGDLELFNAEEFRLSCGHLVARDEVWWRAKASLLEKLIRSCSRAFLLSRGSIGAKQLVLTLNNSPQFWASGSWDGNVFSQIPEMTSLCYNFSFENTNSSFYASYTSKNGTSSGLGPEINVTYMVSAALTDAAAPTIFSSAAAWKASPLQTLAPGIHKSRGLVAVFD
ncbi:S-locus-specific glycoprotein S6-like [Cryptomeria japonica]|uniref:S-locus-specific glycoprotein S6-like n=1 Tax=Cryptomeria japonica TaxID=3369 RepID=UPI0025ACD109|nr:S-locus-specific glycoprotein S6-like [Cryptomeria japonica]